MTEPTTQAERALLNWIGMSANQDNLLRLIRDCEAEAAATARAEAEVSDQVHAQLVADYDAALADAARLREALVAIGTLIHESREHEGRFEACGWYICTKGNAALAATPDTEKWLAEHHGDTGRESYAAVRGKAVAGSLHPASPHPKRHTRYGWDALLAQTLAIRPIIDAEIARRDRIAAGDKTAGSMPPAEWDALASLPASANLPARYLDLDSPEAERRLLDAVGDVPEPEAYMSEGAWVRAILAALRRTPYKREPDENIPY